MPVQLRLKPSMYILEENPQVYQFIMTGTRKIKRFQVDALVKDVVAALSAPASQDQVLERLKPLYNLHEIFSCISSLEREGIIEKYSPDSLNERFEKQISFLSESTGSFVIAQDLQKRLSQTKVVVFGAGGIGSWMVNGLYQIGIGEIRVVDSDIIDPSNLNRQLFYMPEDVGKSKTEVLSNKITGAKVIPFKRWVREDESLEDIVEGCNFLVNCTDSPSVADTTRIISKFANKHKIPYQVSGGYNLHLGMVGPIIVPGITACFDCFLENQKANDSLSNLKKIKDIEQTGNVGPIAGAIANIQVMDVFKYLTKIGDYHPNRFAEIDFMNLSIEWREFRSRPDCNCYKDRNTG